MIAVIGEALIDLVAGSDGRFAARPGGAGFNTARTIGRLGVTPVFLDRLSGDGFGRLLRSTLDSDGVTLALAEPTGLPTTLALVDLDPAGVPRYRFYLDGTSAPALEYPVLAAALPAGLTALHAGGLALVAEPIATSIDRLISSGPAAGHAADDRPELPAGGDRRPAGVPGPAVPDPAPCRRGQGQRGRPGLPGPGHPGRGRGRRPARPGARAGAADRRPAPGPGVPARRGGQRGGAGRAGGRHRGRGRRVRRGVPCLVVAQRADPARPAPARAGPRRAPGGRRGRGPDLHARRGRAAMAGRGA